MNADPEEGQPTTAPEGTPLVAGRYRLVSELGGGAMGVVWLARDEVLGRDVAVKELRPDHGMSGAQVRTSHQRARREGRIAARLQHPNAVTIYDVAEHDGRPYLIMEYVPSQNLGDILATGAVLTPAEVTRIGAQLASALTAAHERGIVHRDIKPGNVLMAVDGTVKLTDFGISRATGDATVTATGEILGTPAFTAPEVAQGHPVAFPADVFSLGATLYAAAEGTPPFGEDANAMATLLRVVRNEIRPPKRSGPLTDTVMRMLRPEPADRPTMREAWHGLDALSNAAGPAVGTKADLAAAVEVKPFVNPSPTLLVPETAAAAEEGKDAESRLPALQESAAVSVTSDSALDSASGSDSASASDTASGSASVAATGSASVPPATSEHPALAADSPLPASRSRSRMPLAIAICVVGTTVLIVAIVVAMNAGTHSSGNQPVAHGSSATTQSSASHPTTPSQSATTPSTAPSSTPSTSASSSPSTTPSTSASGTAAQMTSFLTNYYSLLPGNLTQAWPSLMPEYQANTAKGLSGYTSFWGHVQKVTVSDVVAKAPSTVDATIDYYGKDGSRTEERTSFGLVQDGGTWKIASSSVLSSRSF